MVHSVVKTIKKYLRIYGILFKFGLIRSTQFRANFFIEFFIEIGYQIVTLVFYTVVYSNIREVAGWSYYEVLFFTGMNIVAQEVAYGTFYIQNLRMLPRKIVDGDLDRTLLKPINSLFYISLSSSYFTSYISAIAGFVLMGMAAVKMHLSFNVVNTLVSMLIFICGMILWYSVIVILSALSFKFMNAESLPSLGQNAIGDFKARPHQIYTGLLGRVFTFVIPVIFITSLPAWTILRGVEMKYALLAPFLATLFLSGAILLWNKMIKLYSSASS
jgi:ABC-2 type transport system permease protein